MACFVCLEQLPARPLIFSFGSGATFGRRLFRHAVPGCFPDLKGALARRDETASCPEPNEKIKGLAGNCSRHTNQATRHPSNQENILARRDETAPAVPLLGPNVTPEPNEKIKGLAGNYSRHTKQAARHPSNQENTLAALNRVKKSRVWQALVPGTQNKPQDTLQIRKTPWHGVTKQPPAVPLPGPNVTPEPTEKIKGLAGNCSRRTKQATRHPSNQENTLARRDETASCRPSARAKGSGRQLFQARKTSHKTSNQENTLARRGETASCRPSARAKRHS